MVAEGKSGLVFPKSKHNRKPTLAIDAIPYPIKAADWEDRIFWIEWSSWVKGHAAGLGIILISGYDWDNDYDYGIKDQKFWDGPHFELDE